MKNPDSKLFILAVLLFECLVSFLLLWGLDSTLHLNSFMNLFGLRYFGQLPIFFVACYVIYPITLGLLMNVYLFTFGRKDWKSWIKISENYAVAFNITSILPMLFFGIEFFSFVVHLGFDPSTFWGKTVFGVIGIVGGYYGFLWVERKFFMTKEYQW